MFYEALKNSHNSHTRHLNTMYHVPSAPNQPPSTFPFPMTKFGNSLWSFQNEVTLFWMYWVCFAGIAESHYWSKWEDAFITRGFKNWKKKSHIII